jgi:biotin carboxylase
MSRVLLLVTTTSYRLDDFIAASRRLGVELLVGTDRCHRLAELWPEAAFGSVQIEMRDTAHAVDQIAAAIADRPVAGIVATDEPTAVIAALAADRLGLPGNAPEAVALARNKHLMRQRLAEAGVPCPAAQVFGADEDPVAVATRVAYPVVLKPLLLSTSRGVIRADDSDAFIAAFQRVRRLLARPELSTAEAASRQILVEPFVAGAEVALEGILRAGELTVLALFDKPDPLDGPFFEETIYVTPSRHPPPTQVAIRDVAARAAVAMGLREGPVHAELRLSDRGPQVLEVAARSIGGLCARTLRFGLAHTSLEEVVLGQVLGRAPPPARVDEAAGVMMIPTPRGGVLREVRGLIEARAVPLVEDVVISARPGEVLVPLPEGSSYLGFIFARGRDPAEVESALRSAYARLTVEVAPRLN